MGRMAEPTRWQKIAGPGLTRRQKIAYFALSAPFAAAAGSAAWWLLYGRLFFWPPWWAVAVFFAAGWPLVHWVIWWEDRAGPPPGRGCGCGSWACAAPASGR